MLNRRKFLSLTVATSILPGLLLFPDSALAARRQTFSYGPASLDILAPTGKRNMPVMIYVHGGGWQTGSRTNVLTKPAFFNAMGMIFVTIDYRLLPNFNVQTQASDVAKAIHWVKNNIAQIGGDPSRLAVMGHSAGAHLATLAVISGNTPPVKALISNDTGAYDLAAFAAERGGQLPRTSAKVFNDPGQWAELSPSTYVGRSRHPATMLMWSEVKHHEALARLFATKLTATGTPVTSFAAPELTHAQINKQIGSNNPARLDRAIAEFLAANL